MLRLDKVIKPWKESAALNDHINLYGFWNETAFLTKSGDVGMILSVPGVDYESLDRSQQEYAVKRLEAALKAFGPGFHVYQYLFKSNRPDIPFATYDDPIVEAPTTSGKGRTSSQRSWTTDIRLCRQQRAEPLDYRRARIRRCRASPSHLASTARNRLCASFPRSPGHLFREFWFKTRDTQTIHRASVSWYSLLLFTGHYGATGAL